MGAAGRRSPGEFAGRSCPGQATILLSRRVRHPRPEWIYVTRPTLGTRAGPSGDLRIDHLHAQSRAGPLVADFVGQPARAVGTHGNPGSAAIRSLRQTNRWPARQPASSLSRCGTGQHKLPIRLKRRWPGVLGGQPFGEERDGELGISRALGDGLMGPSERPDAAYQTDRRATAPLSWAGRRWARAAMGCPW